VAELEVWSWGNWAERGPPGHCSRPTSQHLGKNLRNDGEPAVDGYTKTQNHRKILRKTQKNNLLKTKRIQKRKYRRICL